ncbi:polysaccharide biosynthesis/export family protein [Brevundimonas sp.]|uniref:polysaccharide biosynthesis/export family protein n=1 Tax=Brevundimonas sp. TaxID=1871086 RepID=UPI002FCA1B7E
MIDRRFFLGGLAIATTGCASSRASSRDDSAGITGFRPWSDIEPPYVLFPGDELDLALPSAPELNRALTLAPDGRISLPMAGHVMAAERSLHELETDISAAYAQHLVRPAVELSLRRSGPAKVWVDGQVRNPGAYDLPGEQINAYQAMVLAGGASLGSKTGKAALIRRGPDGYPMMTTVDLGNRSLFSPRVRRGDIIFVPRTGLGEITAFFTQVREAMPIGFSYALNGWN